eukprot:TRINITY_DN1680_c0_g1_i1.p1 TRINITY_DN1680_c0_g1~~TRINITY_DN1680_c0_g1_i1.p1  ORF type:complete len:363 (-),score=51.92 TRINITY_DN1680_c0_g1_i1:239-1327(-)
MSCCGENTPEKQISRAIDQSIKTKKAEQTFQILLLGCGDSGKSTFLKQLRYLHEKDNMRNDEVKFASIIRDNCLQCMKIVLRAYTGSNSSFPNKLEDLARLVLESDTLTEEVAKAIKDMIKDDSIKNFFEKSYHNMPLPGGISGARYFFEKAKDFASPKYVPSEDDVLRCKIRTTGVVETPLTINGSDFNVIDVGGQRSERRKWIHAFSNVSVVIYIAALNEYDMVLEEDSSVNRMEESLKLFEKLSESKWFSDIPFVLFLNKKDSFLEEIKRWPLSECFEDYDHFASTCKPNQLEFDKEDKLSDVEKISLAYIRDQFQARYSGKSQLFVFYTCALDRNNCSRVFDSVLDNMLNDKLKIFGE